MDRISDKQVGLLGLAIGSDAILAQESHGQHALVNSCELPKDCRGDRALLEKWGIKFGAETDELFVKVELPAGWKKVRSEHSMWSWLVDHTGRRRASIFYKAAFYDRCAFMSACRRFPIECVGREVPVIGKLHCQSIQDGGPDRTLHIVSEMVTKENERAVYKGGEQVSPSIDEVVRLKAEAWLDENRPGWRDRETAWSMPMDDKPQPAVCGTRGDGAFGGPRTE